MKNPYCEESKCYYECEKCGHNDFINEIVAKVRADAIDECKTLFRKYILTKEIEGLDELFEQLKEKNK